MLACIGWIAALSCRSAVIRVKETPQAFLAGMGGKA